MANQTNRWALFLASRGLNAFKKGGWALTVSILTFAGLILACIYLWQNFGDQIVGQSKYKLSVERLNVTPQPEWIRKTNVKKMAIIRGRLQGIDIRQVDLGPRISSAFLGSPWVKEVSMVNKSSAVATGVNVRIEYRKPVAMVIVDATPYEVEYQLGLFPVDIEGCLLPLDEFDDAVANRYPKIGPVNSQPVGSPGDTWGDARISEAATIIEFLGELWNLHQFVQIEVPSAPSQQSNAGNYVLVDRDQRRWVWGSAVDIERPDEAAAAEKLARLKSEKHLTHQRDQAGNVDLTAATWEPLRR